MNVMDNICRRQAMIRSVIGRYHFGREFQSETRVNIRNPNQITKGHLAGPLALAFTRVFAKSLFSRSASFRHEALSKGYYPLGQLHSRTTTPLGPRATNL